MSGKLALRYSGPNVEAMKSIAQASQKRSLANFQKVKLFNFGLFGNDFFYSNVSLTWNKISILVLHFSATGLNQIIL